ncbi:hypothetical protein [Pedobacter duraquae]|uniref:Uncharacterized protein n=1 Tax=Pedobacter duraquae TaxID=425511 RepID=A0A4V3C2P0_9SPHI|nr:hypothetical protein [Pedobacter duraquae]TDO19039.1 hypothetical protein CLV32_4661 [Pedobacter duraquae]
MKKLIYKLTALTVLIGFVFSGCRNPAYDINVLFDAAVIQYKATLILSDAAGGTLPTTGITATITGADAASIYDFSGTKAVPVTNGIITLGVTPKDIPTSAKTLSFNVVIAAPGYDTRTIPVSIALNQFGQIIDIPLLKTVVPTPASSVVSTTIPVNAAGATTAPVTFATPSTGNVPQQTAITVPAGVSFKDAAGTTLIGTVTAQAVNFDASDPVALALFPGGDLSAPNVKLADGTTGSAFFYPAGFTDINMYVGGVAVRNFTTPITIGMQLDETFRPQATGQPLAVGNQIGIYSYRDNAFQFETNATVIRDAAGKLAVSFQTNHLTVFIAGDVVKTANCKPTSVTFSAAWMQTATTPLTVQILDPRDNSILDERTVLVKDGGVDIWSGLPPTAYKYRIIWPATGATLSEGSVTNGCDGTAYTITVAAPGTAPVVSVSLMLGVICPGKGIISVPDFDLFYKPAGSTAAYTLLGTVKNGQLRSILLQVGSAYDFRANWGTQTKTVLNKTITSADLSTTVGDGVYLGDKKPTANKALLIEACKN